MLCMVMTVLLIINESNQLKDINFTFYILLPKLEKFSTGNRNCIGQNFAVTELKMAVAKAIYNFHITAHEAEKVTRLCVLVQKTH